MKSVNCAGLIIFGVMAILIMAACDNPPQTQTGPNNNSYIIVENATSVTLAVSEISSKPDKVELIYFHTKNPCHCMAVVQDNIQYAVDTYFKNEVANGRVKLTMVVSDDPANAALVQKYNAMLFTLFIKETRDNTERIYPVSDIWNMTGDDNRDKLVNFIKLKVNSILEGKSS
ncbi:MAG: nitrophenyl compound nitroreductase subunit ArsF family protein [Chloroflexi bacterium]|nr:nitrophenyl compound nitroreductase subunit ArsF family protein [Chloroflexota bacterium]